MGGRERRVRSGKKTAVRDTSFYTGDRCVSDVSIKELFTDLKPSLIRICCARRDVTDCETSDEKIPFGTSGCAIMPLCRRKGDESSLAPLRRGNEATRLVKTSPSRRWPPPAAPRPTLSMIAGTESKCLMGFSLTAERSARTDRREKLSSAGGVVCEFMREFTSVCATNGGRGWLQVKGGSREISA